jgi:hypothetical protein
VNESGSTKARPRKEGMTKSKQDRGLVENVMVLTNAAGGEKFLEIGKQDADLKQIYAV